MTAMLERAASDVIGGAGAMPAPPDARPETRLAVISRFPSVRAGLRALIEAEPGHRVVAEASSPELLRDTPFWREVGVLVVDLAPGQELGELEDGAPRDAALVILGADGRAMHEALQTLPRPLALLRRDAEAAELLAAVRSVQAGLVVLDPALALELAAGEPVRVTQAADGPLEELTPREREVLQLLVEGLPNKTIARRLGISDHTVKFHVGSVLSKLGAASRTEAVRLAARRGLVAL
jgi:DNA-binding NarL/FixJ family response regulator